MSAAPYDVAIVGGGPAGLAVAIESARRGLSTIVLERATAAPDKACGEGLLPGGLRWLEAAGVRARLSSADATPFTHIRWIEADGRTLVGRLPAPGGLGVRRTALTAALAERAVECGAELRPGTAVRAHARDAEGVRLDTAAGEVRARLLVGADGLHSRVRRDSGLDARPAAARRFGWRLHYRVAPWSREVEVHLLPGIQAYVTPVGDVRVGVAFLWEADGLRMGRSVGAFLAQFPALAARLGGAPLDSDPEGAGPLWQRSRAPIADRLALVGDAAGFVDAISGDGLTLAFRSAAALGATLPAALAQGATRAALAPYARAHARAFRSYAICARALLALARRERLRGAASQLLRALPGSVDGLMRLALADGGPRDRTPGP